GLRVKGVLYLELVMKSLSIVSDGSYAAALASAPWRLIRALNLIKDEDERVSGPGWYDKVENLTEEEERVLEEEPFDGESFKRYYGAQSFVGGITASQAKKALARRPTANIAGIWAGYTGPGSKTVLPKEIHCKMYLRLVPMQDPAEVIGRFKDFLKEKGYGDVAVEVE